MTAAASLGGGVSVADDRYRTSEELLGDVVDIDEDEDAQIFLHAVSYNDELLLLRQNLPCRHTPLLQNAPIVISVLFSRPDSSSGCNLR